jgi:hypothetical protein
MSTPGIVAVSIDIRGVPKMKHALLATSLIAIIGNAHALEGPFFHTSDGVTSAIVENDASGNVIRVECVPGSLCVNKTASRFFSNDARQTSSFIFTTTNDVGSDHFAFGVRGNSQNIACSPPSVVKDMPFLGRGMIIYPLQRQVKFENFTLNCVGPGSGVAESTSRTIDFEPATTYRINVWADATNTGYSVARQYEDIIRDRPYFRTIASGNCLAQASALDAYKCAKTPQDVPSANRAFIISTQWLKWQVSNWYLQ